MTSQASEWPVTGPPEAARERLLDWFARGARDLPWRRHHDPWAIWVSEVMLQQTRVAVVVERYEEFLGRFPGPAALAAATEEEAVAAWAGLGYYRRVRLLRRAAQRVTEEGMPETAAELRRLPGVGSYTAAAIASIAFGEAVAVVDGNVERVLARWHGEPRDPRRQPAKGLLYARAAAWLDPARPGDWNQALMELGATVCTPQRPRCGECPLRTGCRAAAEDTVEQIPARPRRRAPERRLLVALWCERDGRVLVLKRSGESEVLAGTWELPWVPDDGEDPAGALTARYGGRWELGREVGTIRHAITFRRLAVRLVVGRLATPTAARAGEARWVRPEELPSLAASSLLSKAAATVSRSGRPGRRPG